jgi:hypothetical protein
MARVNTGKVVATACVVVTCITVVVALLERTPEGAQVEHASPQAEQRTQPRPLHLSRITIPDLGVAHYRTSGTYPQVAGRGLDMTAVNAALSSTAMRDERDWRKAARQHARATYKEMPVSFRGVYQQRFTTNMAVANTALVSVMYPTLSLFPGGNDGGGWLSTTVKVPSARPITLANLFGADWLNIVARQTRFEVEQLQYCQPHGLRGLERRFYDKGLEPKPANYTHFSLTADGVDIGLQQGQIGAEACGTKRITLPWTTLEDDLTPRGQVLAHLAGHLN